MRGNSLRQACGCAVLLGMLMLIPSALAEIVEVKLPTGVIATADFRPGRPLRPAVLVLPGFLQTRNALPMSALANTLSDQEYTVLAPTLSLGVNRRTKSLACEAVHAHSINDDIAEISFWVNWLSRKGYHSIALVGHSFGSTQILYYLAQKAHPAAKQAILTSLVPLTRNPQEAQKASARVKQAGVGDNTLERYTLGYCNNNYVAPAVAYLSYASIDSRKTLEQFGKASGHVEVILGAADKAMEPGWPQQIRAHGTPVTIIDNASHFFDGAQEFDLAEKVETILKTLPAERR